MRLENTNSAMAVDEISDNNSCCFKMEQNGVQAMFSKVSSEKAAGPKSLSAELPEAWCPIIQLSAP